MKFFKILFAETESFWSQGPVTQNFEKSYSIQLRKSTFKHFHVCSASDEIVSAYAQPAMKCFPRMLSIFNYVVTFYNCITQLKKARFHKLDTKMNIYFNNYNRHSLGRLAIASKPVMCITQLKKSRI